jgi:two-component system response regulator NreC
LLDSGEAIIQEVKILIADDHQLVREALRQLCEKQEDFAVIAEARDGREAVKYACELVPDVIIMDITMPNMNGLEATRYIKTKLPQIGILVLTVHSDNEHIISILKAGASGFLTKTSTDQEIVNAIRALVAGDTVLSTPVSMQIFKYAFQFFKERSSPVAGNLTIRELETLKLAAKGIPNKEIAGRLGISLSCTKQYMTNVLQKLNVASRTEAVAVSLQAGILTIDDIEQ